MLKATASSVDITPARLLPAACHGPVDGATRSIAEPFEANVVVLRDEDRTVVIVSLDWFFVSPGFRAEILKACEGALVEESLFVAASHAHTSPATDETKPGFSSVNRAYVQSVESAVAMHIRDLLRADRWKPVSLRFATTACDCAVNRRKRVWRPEGVRMRHSTASHPNPAGPRDRELRMLRLENESGHPLAVIWGVSCHPTEWPLAGELSPDYPGHVRRALRTYLADEIPVLFLQGFCGDLRPPAVGWLKRTGSLPRRALALANSLVNGPGFVGFTREAYEAWANIINVSALRSLDEASRAPRLEGRLTSRRASVPLSALGLSGGMDQVTCHWLDLSADLRIVGVSAEVCWDYARLVAGLLRDKAVWPVGYIDNVFGYLPTGAMLPEGGYEVTGFRRPFGIEGEFVADTENVVLALLSS